MRTRTLLTAAFLLCAAGCAESGSTPDLARNTSPGDPAVLAGTFQILLLAENGDVPAFTTVVGRVHEGAALTSIVWSPARSAGACRLLMPRVPRCDTPCARGTICAADGQCRQEPPAQSVGEARLRGVQTTTGSDDFTLGSFANTYQLPSGTYCPYPAFSEGAEISLSATGGGYAPFTLSTRGIAPLILPDTVLPLQPDQGATLTWTPPRLAGVSRINVRLDISRYGGPRGVIECDADDTGSLELPAELVTELLGLGASGYPRVSVTRNAIPGAAVLAPGRVELGVTSTVERPVQVPGVTSCHLDSQCPSGQRCQPDLKCG